jgi:hypothetical protein
MSAVGDKADMGQMRFNVRFLTQSRHAGWKSPGGNMPISARRLCLIACLYGLASWLVHCRWCAAAFAAPNWQCVTCALQLLPPVICMVLGLGLFSHH